MFLLLTTNISCVLTITSPRFPTVVDLTNVDEDSLPPREETRASASAPLPFLTKSALKGVDDSKIRKVVMAKSPVKPTRNFVAQTPNRLRYLRWNAPSSMPLPRPTNTTAAVTYKSVHLPQLFSRALLGIHGDFSQSKH
ncbi:hypothetical protein K504DRAFT_91237 [Pleomassaria siparia CBS 279.74]|uniref:Uncharacterized protein n=1 Tax=Pleomassaria siparia CBS 279.74 TaxID=1314801 RepID=A0A6G1JZ26_9PLEO|nr:hypothetical protein K504DRAFT_91237 [Pleomassaria siparia CBS 279.74]